MTPVPPRWPLRVLCAALCLLCGVQCAMPRGGRNGEPPKPRPPLTMNESTNRWTCRDGKEMPYTRWAAPAGPARGAVICVHGLSGAASDFWPIGEALPADGFAVYGLQLRGQGNDPEISRRGDIRSAAQWTNDLKDFTRLVRASHPGIPIYWYGESLGALITINAAADQNRIDDGVKGIILASPVVALRESLRLPFVKNLAVRTLLRFLPGKRVSLENLGDSEVQVTSHTTHREQMQNTAHYIPRFTLRLFGQVESLIRGSDSAAANIHLPVLALYTPNDALVPAEAVEVFFDKLAARDKSKMFFPRSFHLILHDVDRAAAIAGIREWLDKRAPRPRPE